MYSQETLAAIKKALGPKRKRSLIAADERMVVKGDKNLVPLPGSERERLEQKAAQGTGTLPERIIQRWLETSGIPFFAQQIEFGGHMRVGGGVVDFVVSIGAPPGIVIRVQGSYWHTLPDRVTKDYVQRERLIAKGYRIFDAWEHDIYDAVLGGYLGSYMMENLYGG